uniref:Uncharacterized protein n=2 Tax=Trichogramma kaykai TaxID=54128 RepID=A0ABD2VXP6_9HYME
MFRKRGRGWVVKIDKLNMLKMLRKNTNWENEENRVELLHRLTKLFSVWTGPLPNLRDTFRPKEIDQLLLDSVNSMIERAEQNRVRELFIELVARTGYKDEPIIGVNGKPLSLRTTAIHHAQMCRRSTVQALFEIYDRSDVNYTDETTGLTHFHVACWYGFEDIVVKFLELGQNPNCLSGEYLPGLSALQFAILGHHRKIVQLLLRKGADPNFAGEICGFTSLHIIAVSLSDDEFAKWFFETCAEFRQTVQVDARDVFDQTPLQWAVARLKPHMVDVFLDQGADLSGFVYPSINYHGENLEPMPFKSCMAKLKIASTALIIVENLERRGYELDRSDALTIMESFVEFELFDTFEDLDQRQHRWYDDDEFVNKSKEIMMNSSLSLYDLIRLRPEEAEKSLTYSEYLDFARSYDASTFFERHKRACAEHLCEKLARGIFRSWALDSFLKLTNYRCPILCCEMIIDNLNNKDLLNVCLAKTLVESKSNAAASAAGVSREKTKETKAESKPTISTLYRRRLKKTVMKPPLWLILKEEEAAAVAAPTDEAASAVALATIENNK